MLSLASFLILYNYRSRVDSFLNSIVYLNDNIKDTVSSKGTIYGECWYNVTVTYPFKYYEEKELDAPQLCSASGADDVSCRHRLR